MRALVTHEERRDAALDVANFLCDDGLELTAKYPNGSTFTAVGLSDTGDAVLHVELPDHSDAIERIPSASLQYLRPVTAAPTEAGAIDAAAVAEAPRISFARQEDGSYYVFRRTGSIKSKKWKTKVTIVRLGGSVQPSHQDAPARDDTRRRA